MLITEADFYKACTYKDTDHNTLRTDYSTHTIQNFMPRR